MAATGTVHIVDDDPGLRESLRAILERSGYVVTTWRDAKHFLSDGEPAPGCVIADVRMPGIDGLQLQRLLAERRCLLPVIVMTGEGDVSTAVKAMKGGAVDFLEKPLEFETLLAAVDRALRRAEALDQAAGRSASAANRLALLTPREREVLDCLVRDLSNKEIGNELGASPRTIEVHRARVLEKLQAAGVADLVHIVMLAGTTAPE